MCGQSQGFPFHFVAFTPGAQRCCPRCSWRLPLDDPEPTRGVEASELRRPTDGADQAKPESGLAYCTGPFAIAHDLANGRHVTTPGRSRRSAGEKTWMCVLHRRMDRWWFPIPSPLCGVKARVGAPAAKRHTRAPHTVRSTPPPSGRSLLARAPRPRPLPPPRHRPQLASAPKRTP